MSKPMVVTLPVIMILLDYWPLNRFESKKGSLIVWQIKEKIPFFVLSAVLTIINLYNPGKPSTINYLFPLTSRIANAPVSFMTYLEKTFWPHDLAFFYPFSNQLQLWQIMGATFLILIISTAVIIMVKRLPFFFVGWSWYVITLLPVIGIIQIGNFAMADRYTYLPSIGIAIMLAWGVPSLIKSGEMRKKILFPASIIVLAILTILTWKQCGYWQNSNTLFRHALRVTQDNYLAHANLAPVLVEEGKLEEAIDHYNRSIFLIPSADTYYNRGNAYIRLGKYQHAVEDLNKVITLIPASVEAHNNRGAAFIKLGLYKEALDDFSEAIHLNPDYPDAYNNRSFLYFRQGDKRSGCKDAQKACELGDCSVLKASNSKGLCR
jgi:protein O-mannosyl-transferase